MSPKAQMRATIITIVLTGFVYAGIVRPWAARHATHDGIDGLVGTAANAWV
jgi:hypothetical protein